MTTTDTRAAAALLPTNDPRIEIAAKAIYEHWKFGAQGHPWVERGNSLKQDEARAYAYAALNSTTPAQENGSASEDIPEDHGCEYENGDGKCWKCTELARRAKPQGGAVSESMDVPAEIEVNPANDDMVFDAHLRAALVAGLAERARASDQPGADALIEAINDAKMLFNHAGVGTSAQNYASKVVTFLKSLQAPGADAGVGEAVAWMTIDGQQVLTRARKKEWEDCGQEPHESLAKMYTVPLISATNNVSHPAVREVTIEDGWAAYEVYLAEYEKPDTSCSEAMLAALHGIHAVIAEAGVAK